MLDVLVLPFDSSVTRLMHKEIMEEVSTAFKPELKYYVFSKPHAHDELLEKAGGGVGFIISDLFQLSVIRVISNHPPFGLIKKAPTVAIVVPQIFLPGENYLSYVVSRYGYGLNVVDLLAAEKQFCKKRVQRLIQTSLFARERNPDTITQEAFHKARCFVFKREIIGDRKVPLSSEKRLLRLLEKSL